MSLPQWLYRTFIDVDTPWFNIGTYHRHTRLQLATPEASCLLVSAVFIGALVYVLLRRKMPKEWLLALLVVYGMTLFSGIAYLTEFQNAAAEARREAGRPSRVSGVTGAPEVPPGQTIATPSTAAAAAK
jgi:hypothetical protein